MLLQPRPAEGLLLLPGELSGADDVLPIAEHFHQRGFGALGSSLSYRTLEEPARSPHFWQTCADEAENRFDILERYATRVAVLGVGMGALLALHLASVRRVSAVLALFPTLYVSESWKLRLRTTLNRLLRRESERVLGWNHQRRLAALRAQESTAKVAVPLFLVAEDKRDRTDAARSSIAAQKLITRAATQVHVLRSGEPAVARSLPPALLDDLLAFVRKQ
jgi:esterase/lipase